MYLLDISWPYCAVLLYKYTKVILRAHLQNSFPETNHHAFGGYEVVILKYDGQAYRHGKVESCATENGSHL